MIYFKINRTIICKGLFTYPAYQPIYIKEN